MRQGIRINSCVFHFLLKAKIYNFGKSISPTWHFCMQVSIVFSKDREIHVQTHVRVVTLFIWLLPNIHNKKVTFLILKKYDVHTVLARLLTQRGPLLSTPHPNMNHNKPYHPFFASCEILQNFTFYTKNWPSVFANDVHSSNLITQITAAWYFTPPAPTWIIICSDASFFFDREKIKKTFAARAMFFLQNV